MLDIINLALPFFGVILIGFGCGKWQRLPDEGLAWLNFFVLFVTLPALFFRTFSRTPLEQLAQPSFIAATVLATVAVFSLAFIAGLVLRHGKLGEAVLSGVGGGFGNVGYMGPPLALALLGPQAATPVALVFCFDALMFFLMVPMMMALAGASSTGLRRAIKGVVRSVLVNPLLIAAALGTVAAALHLKAPEGIDRLLQFLSTSAAPCALFALGVTVALRPVGGVLPDVPVLAAIKLIVHPVVVLALLQLLGPFDPVWIATAVLMAALPPALTAYVFARQYGIWIEQASSGVLIGTMLSVPTLISVMWLVQSGTLAWLMGGP